MKFKRNKKFAVKRPTYMSRLKTTEVKRNSCLAESFYSFTNVTKINGFHYLDRGQSRKIQYLWAIILIIILILAGILMNLLAMNFFENSTIISRSHPTSLLSIPFPAITICPTDPISPLKLKAFLKLSKIPDNMTQQNIETSIGILNGFIQGEIDNNSDAIEVTKVFMSVNNLTIPEVMTSIGMTCDDYIKKYSIYTKIHECTAGNCSAWKMLPTINGLCCSFNFNPRDVKESIFSNKWGKHSGINIIFDGRVATRAGFNMFIHHTTEFITKAAQIFSLIPGYENFFRIFPQRNRPSKYYLSLPLKSRKCYLPQDRNLTFFQQSRCRLTQYIQGIHGQCGCHPYFLPTFTMETIRNCTIEDLQCFGYSSETWIESTNDCWPSCFQTPYILTKSDTIIQHLTSVMRIYRNITQIDKPFTAHIFYGRHDVKVLERIPVMTWIDLIANLGGILNLTLGISLVSVCEIFYYFVYKFIKIYKKRQP